MDEYAISKEDFLIYFKGQQIVDVELVNAYFEMKKEMKKRGA